MYYTRLIPQSIKNTLTYRYFFAEITEFSKWYVLGLYKKTLLVYTMGKVGSTSIVNTLSGIPNFPYLIYHVHLLSPDGIDRAKHIYYGDNHNLFRRSLLPETEHLFQSYYLHFWQTRHYCNRYNLWKIITLVRDPIARNISEFFQVITLYIPDFYERLRLGSVSVDELIETFWKAYNHDVPLEWFDNELKKVFDIDVFESPFPYEKGYSTYTNKNVEVLLIRMEDIDKCASHAIAQFLNLSGNINLVASNKAIEKEYSDIYSRFRKTTVFSEEYIRKMYTSKYATQFYSESEVNQFIKFWSKQT